MGSAESDLLSGMTRAPCTAITRPSPLYSQNVPWKPRSPSRPGYTCSSEQWNPLIPFFRHWTMCTQHYGQCSSTLSRKVLLSHVPITLKETLQTLFWELKSSLCIGLNVRQSSPVLWIEKQLWCCDAAVSACAVQLEINQTKYSATNKTQQNKCRWGESFNASLRVYIWVPEEMTR